MDDVEVMKQVQIAFEYTYLHDDWVTPLSELLDGVSLEEALWKPSPESNSIWRIVLHTAKWNENIVDRVEHRDSARPGEDAHWPQLPDPADEQGWQDAQARLKRSFELVANMLANASLEKIQASRYGLGDVLCRFTHIGYHFGQITKIRESYALINR